MPFFTTGMTKFIKKQYRGKEEFKKEKDERRAKNEAKPDFKKPQQKTGEHTASKEHPKFPPRHSVEGTIRISSKEVGYVAVEGMDDDIEIDPRYLNTALDRDRVEIVLFGKVSGKRQGGEVTKIILRFKTKFAGMISKEEGVFFFIADDNRMYKKIMIPKHHLYGAKEGDKVFVELTKWDEPKKEPLGEVRKILGKPNEHNAEMQAIVLERGFETTFPPDVEAAAELIPMQIPPEEIAKRRDFRSILTFTIDPKDAKDFDDALSWQKLPNGNIEVGVHIADVSYYVTPGSRIDKEAVERATSVYLVDRTIPMLPERLSNGICSLVPNEDRLTFAAVFEMNERGDVLKQWFGRTIIHSAKRFTYEEAQEVLNDPENKNQTKNPILGHKFEESLRKALLSLDKTAKNMRTARIANGAIAFEAEEVKFELDEKGKPISVYKKVIQDTNKLIEEFMLLANKEVARFIATRDERTGNLFVYRVHDVPNEDKIRDLRDFLHGIGFELKLDKHMHVTSRGINEMLEEVRGRAEESMIQMATVRAMAKAVYTTKNIGHYGLGFEYYTHFTSPIRRYPDTMVHRLLAYYLENKPIPKKMLEDQERLARFSSQMEVQAADAERTSIKYKQCEYFSERVGTEIDGRISGVTEWGIYIEDSVTKAEGMINVRDIPDDFYFFEEKNYRLVGKTHGKIYRLGDKLKARVSAVDLKRKLIAMKLVSTTVH